jgi:hypothetical protein
MIKDNLIKFFFLDFNTVQDIKISKIESNSISGSYVNPAGQFSFINIKCFNDKNLYELNNDPNQTYFSFLNLLPGNNYSIEFVTIETNSNVSILFYANTSIYNYKIIIFI